MTVFVLAGASGLFGRGPLSKVQIGSGSDPMSIEYERFARYKTPETLKVTLDLGSAQNGQVRLRISNELVQTLRLEQTSPHPVATMVVPGGTAFLLSRRIPSARGRFGLRRGPNRFGRVSAYIEMPGVKRIQIDQIVYP